MTTKGKRDSRSGITITIPIDVAYTVLLLMTGTADYAASLAVVNGELLLSEFTCAAAVRRLFVCKGTCAFLLKQGDAATRAKKRRRKGTGRSEPGSSEEMEETNNGNGTQDDAGGE
ncbi:hypothetical protein HDU90_008131 [Geranomyces variabilis]|nr:hypothetical protein HDU90_008131 [Geranomyces variabilis]